MAKWGEGDPRWIVEERPDATNVNNWHWTEKNASQWSRDVLTSLFVGLKIDEPGLGFVEITSMESLEGEAVANNRKGKLIFFYEWVIKLKWKACLYGQDISTEQVEGELEIPNLSEENAAHEVDVNVSIKNNDVTSEIMKELLRNKGTEVIREQIGKYITMLRDDFAKDLIKPTKLNEGGGINAFQTESSENKKASNSSATTSGVKKNVLPWNGEKKKDEKLETGSLEMKEEMKCTAEEFYRAYTDVDMVEAFTRDKIVLDASVNGKFVLFGGNVSGTFTHLEPNKCIKQRWRFKHWPDGHFSEVVITLDQKDDCTIVQLNQSGVPKSDMEKTENGWKRYYFDSMKQRFGFGASLH